jgi:hypothetical protein
MTRMMVGCDALGRRMFALAFAGLPSPVNTDEGGGAGTKKTQAKSKGGAGGEAAKMLMNDDQLLGGEAMTNVVRRPDASRRWRLLHVDACGGDARCSAARWAGC